MIEQKQLNLHDPDNDIYGDCYRTSIACVLGLSHEEVPHFFDKGRLGGEAMDMVFKFLEDRGMRRIVNLYDVGKDEDLQGLERILLCNGVNNPGSYFLLSGQSKIGCNHTVVCYEDKIVWDPSRQDSGIVGPCDDGYYWLEFFGVKL